MFQSVNLIRVNDLIKSWHGLIGTIREQSTTLLEITSMAVSRGFEVEWTKIQLFNISPQYFVEDGLGILLLFLDRCVDDRTNSVISVSFTVVDDSLLSATMVQDDIKLVDV